MTNPSPLESQTTSENVNEGALTNSRIQHSVESLKEQMKVTEEELEFRIKKFDSVDSKEHSKYFKCTKCGVSFQSKINKGEELSVHPLLDVLMCVSCCDYYGNGEFSLDSDGEDKYCRWCGEGGTLFSCSKCICAFCKKCIKKHFDVSGLEKVEQDDDWVCYFCDVKPLWHMRWVCSLAKEKSETNRKELGSKQQETKVIKKRKRRRIHESNSDLNINTSDGSESNNNAKSTNAGPSKKLRKKRLRRSLRSNICFDSSSSGENEKENLENSYKRKNLRSRNSEKSENTLESESKNLQKRSKLEEATTTEQPDESSITEKNRFLVVDKFRGVWKLTQIVAEICLRYSKERLEVLSKPSHIKSLSDLKEEYEKLRSVTTMVSSTIHKACDSVESLKSDLSCRSVKDESHVFRCEEANLKSLAKKLFSESEEEGQSDYSVKNVKNKYTKRKERKSEETENISCSLFGVSDSENENSRKTTSEKEENSVADKRPVLKVKDFAKMNNENIFKEESKEEGGPRDGEKQNQTNEYDVDTDTEESSGVEEVKNEKNNKGVSGSESSGTEKISRAKTRSIKDKEVLKDKFYEFREKRVKYLENASQRTKSSEKSTEKNEFFEGSGDDEGENNGRNSSRKRKKRNQILSSDDEKDKNDKTESESEASFVLSEENESDSDVGSSSDEEGKKTGSRQKRKKNQNGNKDESSKSGNEEKGDDEDDGNDTGNKDGKKGRRNIKKILKKDSLKLTTKEALKNEENRRKRIEERHKLLKDIMNENGSGENTKDEEGSVAKKLVLDFDVETKKPLVSVHEKLMRKLKSHQIEGVRFMWDNCFESVEQSEKESGSGCILAHYMGLGKTLQVVTLVHTVMTHDIGVNTVLIICPLGIVNNWSKEFELWLSEIKTKAIMLYDMNHCKSSESRCSQLREWQKTGGVMVLSYDLFRTLTVNQTKSNKLNRTQKVYVETLLDPGPDVVVCDEGHLLKNEDTALSKCVNRIKTARRIVLTGTPLQNNLREYHCMVQFVKPNILGTKKEFANRFINPITNGQFEDSTEQDVRVMKRRSHVLHSMLEGCVQRFDYSVLTPYLPEKQEYVLSISLTEAQAQAYRHFIENLSTRMSKGSKTATLFNDYHNLQRIWTHPRVLLMHKEKETQKADNNLMKSSLNKFVVNSDEETPSTSGESSDEASVEEVTEKRVLRSNSSGLNLEKNSKVIENESSADVKNEWWSEYFKDSDYEDIRASNKLLALFFLLKSFGEAGDKALVFSQSLYSLDLIEHFLNKIDDQNDESFSEFKDNWVHGIDYFRLDGTTNSDLRTSWCETFNKKSNKRARLFLISTKAGGLGINLFSANRVIVFDASWNPSHDLQSIFRVYRFGQKKTCYVYRFLAEATMEEKIYERQVTKLSLSHRVVDELQIERHYSMMNLQELYNFAPTPKENRKMPKIPKDKILADLLFTYHDAVVDYHEHDSLLENKEEEELTEEERKTAWQEFEQEKEQKMTLSNLSSLQNVYSSGTVQAIPGYQAQTSSSSFYSPLQTQVPLQILERGFKVGLIPLYGETTEAYTTRVLNRELFLGTSQRET